MSPIDLKSLQRYPKRSRELLQAWDSADELLIAHVRSGDWRGKRIAILNDSFGALSSQLEDLNPLVYTDSHISAQAIRLNTGGRVDPVTELEAVMESRKAGGLDLAILRIPKNLSFLDDQLAQLSQCLKPGAPIVCSYMVKHQANSAFDLIAKRIGPTRTSLAERKSRLIFAEFSQKPSASPYPRPVPMDGFTEPFIQYSNLFSRERLDIGTRFFLEHLPEVAPESTVWDLGCGNGIVGIAIKLQCPNMNIVFSDDSMMAIQSARANFEKYFPGESAEFRWANGGEGQPDQSVDLVLCNPPFHQGMRVGDDIALEMFREARRALNPGGRIRVIGNAHLHYPAALERLFGNHEIVARNPKFTIVEAVA